MVTDITAGTAITVITMDGTLAGATGDTTIERQAAIEGKNSKPPEIPAALKPDRLLFALVVHAIARRIFGRAL